MAPITPDGIAAAASWEHSFHPKRTDGKDLTAWERRRVTLEATIAEVNRLGKELSKLKEDISARPF
jgi:hypothetical protein